MLKQTTSNIVMIRPKHFAFNKQTASNNVFQNNIKKSDDILEKVLEEFDNMVNLLKSKDINVIVFDDRSDVITPDSIFPNNWVSFHQDNSAYIYKMFAKNRALEIREDIFNHLKNQGFILDNIHRFNQQEEILEGTGAIVLDRVNKIAYCSLSQRASRKALEKWASISQYKTVIFNSKFKDQPVYHTNVIMSIANKYAIICLEAIVDQKEKEHVIFTLKESGKEIIDVSLSQVKQFVANTLLIHNNKNQEYLIMSSTSYNALNQNQKEIILKYNQIIYSDISTIEQIGGGSARCMIAENFLKKG